MYLKCFLFWVLCPVLNVFTSVSVCTPAILVLFKSMLSISCVSTSPFSLALWEAVTVSWYTADILFSSTQGASVQSVLFANADGQMGASLKKVTATIRDKVIEMKKNAYKTFSEQSRSHRHFLQGSPFVVTAVPLSMPLIFQSIVTFVFSCHISPTWLGKVAGTQIHPIKNALSNSLQSIIHWVLLQSHCQHHWTTQSEHIAYIWPEIWEWENWTSVLWKIFLIIILHLL